MSARMKMRHTDSQNDQYKIIIVTPNAERVSYISTKNMDKLEAFLEKYAESSEEDKPVAWRELAKDRLDKYKKAGLVLRGMRYREGMSQKELAARSSVNQNEISKIENGKRTVGEKVAKKLAKALGFNYELLLVD
jgi:ribosome-binding protein aMBF1 (putative translation factor)